MLSIQLAIIYYLFSVVFGDSAQWEEEFDHSTYVDPDTLYKMYWTVYEEKVEIGLRVEFLDGWIGWGISPNGQMTHSDVVVAWIDQDMTVKLSNYYTTDNRWEGPKLMEDQSNVELIDGYRDGNYTYFRFYRNIRPCTERGVDIPIGTARVIFAWHDELPQNEESIPGPHEKSDCGSKAVNLLLGETTDYDLPDKDIDTFTLLFQNYSVPTNDTTYFCELMAFPDFDEIHHMIRIDPIITPGNEGIVHHITLTSCPKQYVNENDVGLKENCDKWRNMPNTNASFCREGGAIFAAWAVGGGNFYFPEHVGYEFGGNSPDALKYAIVEVHYDNPQEVAGFIDSSGFKIYYTPHLRNESAEMLSIGTVTAHTGVFVPPFLSPPVIANGYCSSECTSFGLPEQGVHAFGNLLHLHVLGKALKLRHIRDGKELLPIDRNDNYDFDYQQLWILENEMHIMPGDDLYLECHYESPDRDYMTWGGESTRHEMCLSFLYVYPKTDLKMCITQWTEDDYDEFWETAVNNSWASREDLEDHRTWFYDVSEPEAEQYYRDFWTREERDYGCFGGGDNFWSGRITIPEFEEYPEIDYCATEDSSDEGFVWDSWYGYTISIVVGLVAIALFVVVIRMCRKKGSNKNGYQQQLNDEENNNSTKPTKRSNSGENTGVVALQPTGDGNKEYGATTY